MKKKKTSTSPNYDKIKVENAKIFKPITIHQSKTKEELQPIYEKELQEYCDRIDDSPYLRYLSERKANADLTSTICIQIADYCDPEDVRTILSARANAMNPDRLHFVVCYQGDDAEKLIEMQKIPNVTIWHVDKEDANGSCSARYRCNLLVKDEDFIMHLDAHMLFARFWDVGMLEQWRACNDPKAILAAYATGSLPYLDKPLVCDEMIPRIREAKPPAPRYFSMDSVKVVSYSRNEKLDSGTDVPARGMFVSGHCLIAPAELDKTILFDPDMFFLGDETPMAIRYWTSGWNIYHPQHIPVYHLYERDYGYKRGEKEHKVERFFTMERDDPETARFEQLIRLKDNKINLGKFDIGKERSVEDYQKYAGIDFKERKIKVFAHFGKFFRDDLTDFEKSDLDWRLQPEAENARKIHKSYKALNEMIAVAIYAWKDTDLEDTIKRFRNTAANPTRLVYIMMTRSDEEKNKLKKLGYNSMILSVKGEGTLARGLVYQQIEDTIRDNNKNPADTWLIENIIYVDTCTHPVKNWDEYLVESINELGKKAVISNFCYSCSKDAADTLSEKPAQSFYARATEITEKGRISITPYPDEKINDFKLTNTITKHYVFAKASILDDCGHDPDMYLDSDESQCIIDLWTHGYDVYIPPQEYMYYDNKTSNENTDTDPLKNDIESRYSSKSLNKLKLYEDVMTIYNSDMDIREHTKNRTRTFESFKKSLAQ